LATGQQPLGDQERLQFPRVTAFGPDEVLQQLLVVGDRALAAQVERDGDFGHRHRLGGGQAKNVLLVVEGHRHSGGARAGQVGAGRPPPPPPGPAAPPRRWRPPARAARRPPGPCPPGGGGCSVAPATGPRSGGRADASSRSGSTQVPTLPSQSPSSRTTGSVS